MKILVKENKKTKEFLVYLTIDNQSIECYIENSVSKKDATISNLMDRYDIESIKEITSDEVEYTFLNE